MKPSFPWQQVDCILSCFLLAKNYFNNNFKNIRMAKPVKSLKSKFKSSLCPKFKYKTKRRKQQQLKQHIQQTQQFVFNPPTEVRQPPRSLPAPLIYRKPFCTSDNFSNRWQYWFHLQRVQSFYSYLFHKSSLLLYEILKTRICTVSSVLFGLVSLVKAYSTTLAPMVPVLEDDLVVCIPENNSNTCIKYVNSSLNGLIELNESLYPALKGFRGAYDYKMIARINPFWLTFEPPSDFLYYVMGTLYMIIFAFGVTGNGLVIYMFARCKALRTASNILVFNLALCDLIIVIKCPMAAYNNFMRGPALGDWGCRIYGFVGGFSGTASIGMLTVISVDRYSVVVNPLSPLRFNCKSKYYYCLLLIAWLEAFFFSVIPLLEVGLSVYVPEGYLTTCSFDYLDKTMPARVFMFLFFVFAWCLPLFSVCFCYFHILKAVFNSKNIQSNHNKHKIEVRLAFIVLLVIGLWFLAWTPYSIVAMAGVFGMEEHLTPTRSMIPALFCKTAACLNPFLYTISHKRFRNELQRLFCNRQPIYQYSMTRSSYFTRSSRRLRYRVDNGTQSDAHRHNFKEKISIDNATIGGIVNSNLYSYGDLSPNVFQHRPRRKKSSHSRNKISPVVSSEEAGIFVLELNDLEDLKAQPLETNF